MYKRQSYCCPPNLARMIAQLGEYAYATDGTGIYTLLYGDNRAELALEHGCAATLVQKTEYPYDGNIRFTFEDVKQNAPVTLHVRIPGWVRKGSIRLIIENAANHQPQTWKLTREQAGTYLPIEISNPAASTLEIDFGMRCV